MFYKQKVCSFVCFCTRLLSSSLSLFVTFIMRTRSDFKKWVNTQPVRRLTPVGTKQTVVTKHILWVHLCFPSSQSITCPCVRSPLRLWSHTSHGRPWRLPASRPKQRPFLQFRLFNNNYKVDVSVRYILHTFRVSGGCEGRGEWCSGLSRSETGPQATKFPRSRWHDDCQWNYRQ